MRKILVLLLCLGLGGCATVLPQLTPDGLRAENASKLLRLSRGMTKEEVLNIMGTGVRQTFQPIYNNDVWTGKAVLTNNVPYMKIANPYRTEIKRIKDKMYEVLYYYTDKKKSDDAITEDELMPIVLEDNKLIGWGWSFFEETVKKFGVEIRDR